MSISVKLYRGIGSKQEIKTVSYPSSAYDSALKQGFAVHADSKTAVRNYKTPASSSSSSTKSSTSSSSNTSSQANSPELSKIITEAQKIQQGIDRLRAQEQSSGKEFSSTFNYNTSGLPSTIVDSIRQSAIANGWTKSQYENAIDAMFVQRNTRNPNKQEFSSVPNSVITPTNPTTSPPVPPTPPAPLEKTNTRPRNVNLEDYSLVQITGQPGVSRGTIWLLDNVTQTLRPFESTRAVENFFDEPVNFDEIITLTAEDIGEGGFLNGEYEVLSREYAIKSNGTAKALPFSGAQLQARYGQASQIEAEQRIYNALTGKEAEELLKATGVSSSQLAKLKSDPALKAFYVSAMTYGGYTLGDISADLKARQKGLDVLPISATEDRLNYVNSEDYKEVSRNKDLAVPADLQGYNRAFLTSDITNLPDEFFETLIPVLDYDSPEFQKRMDEVETSYYDLLEQQLNANTEQEKAIADYEWQKFQSDIQKNFGIQLSTNALEAWGQIEGLQNNFAGRGIANSGMQEETIDDYLRQVRRSDQIIRDSKEDQTETTRRQYFLTAASSDEIKQLVQSEPETAKKWGLVPSDDVRNALSLSELKKKYPNAKESDLQQYIDLIIDKNGNYRSSLYSKQLGNMIDLASPTLGTTTGINTLRDDFRREKVLENSLLEEENAYREFTTPDSPFLRATTGDDIARVTKKDKEETVDLSGAIKRAVGNFEGTNRTPAPKTKTDSKPATPIDFSKILAEVQSIQKGIDNLRASEQAGSGGKFGSGTASAGDKTRQSGQTSGIQSFVPTKPLGPVQAPKLNTNQTISTSSALLRGNQNIQTPLTFSTNQQSQPPKRQVLGQPVIDNAQKIWSSLSSLFGR